MNDEDRTRLEFDVRRVMLAELRGTIPPGFDVMRGVTFDRAARKVTELCIERIERDIDA